MSAKILNQNYNSYSTKRILSKTKKPHPYNTLYIFSVNVVVQVSDRASYSDVTRVSSLLPGSPPLWLTQQGASFFVSGAKIIMRNLEAYAGNRKQRLHIIDSVLEPLVPSVADNSQAFIDLTAGKLLRESDAYRIEGYSIRYAL
jgi:hypothetical protein